MDAQCLSRYFSNRFFNQSKLMALVFSAFFVAMLVFSSPAKAAAAKCAPDKPGKSPKVAKVVATVSAAKMKLCGVGEELKNTPPSPDQKIKTMTEKAAASAETCSTAMTAASTACVDNDFNPIASKLTTAGLNMMSMLSSMQPKDRCAEAESMLPALAQLATLWQGACLAGKVAAEKACESVSTSVTELNAAISESEFTNLCTGPGAPLEICTTSKNIKPIATKLETASTEAAAAIGQYQEVTTNLASGATSMMMQGRSMGNCSNDLNGNLAGISAPGPLDCSAPKTADEQQTCNCQLNPLMCSGLVGKGDVANPIGMGGGSGSGDAGGTPSFAGGDSGFSVNPGGEIGKVANPGGGGSGGGFGGSGASGKGTDANAKKAAAGSGANVNLGDYGGGGGSRKVGTGWEDSAGKNSQYAKFMPDRKPAAKKELTGAGGQSNWQKISDRARDAAPTMIP